MRADTNRPTRPADSPAYAEPFSAGGSSPPRRLDFRAENHGTVWLLRPLTPAANWFTQEYLPHATTFGRAVVVEHRYVRDLLAGIVAEGLSVL